MPRLFLRPLLLVLILSLACQAGRATAQAPVNPWDTKWLPTGRSGRRAMDAALDALLAGTGLAGQGKTIHAYARRYEVNPAFVLAMYRKEAGFAAPGTRAQANRNPLNIVATGNCHGQPAGARCTGFYGEISTDGRFGVYPRLEEGIKAAFWLLDREYRGLSLRDIIARACPPDECDVDGYVAQVSEWAAEYQASVEAATVEAAAPSRPATPVRGVAGVLALLLLAAWAWAPTQNLRQRARL